VPDSYLDRPEALAAELDAIIEAHNANMAQASGDDAVLDGASELTSTKSVADDTLSNLRDLKARTVAAERELSTGYQEAHAREASKQHLVVSAFGGRKWAGRMRAENKRQISAEKSQAVAPYRQLKLSIDDAIRQVTSAKRGIASSLAEEKRTSPPRKSAADGGMTSELSRLAELHKQGALTDEEFSAAKARLLGASGD
jgi:hypothetical protein